MKSKIEEIKPETRSKLDRIFLPTFINVANKGVEVYLVWLNKSRITGLQSGFRKSLKYNNLSWTANPPPSRGGGGVWVRHPLTSPTGGSRGYDFLVDERN